MSQTTDVDPLTRITLLMNDILPAFIVAGDQQVTPEARHELLRDVRSVRDTYEQERTRVENQLLAAQQTIIVLTAQLRIADEKLTTVEDLVGEVRARMHTRGLATHPIVKRQPKSKPCVSPGDCAPSDVNNHAANSPPPSQPDNSEDQEI